MAGVRHTKPQSSSGRPPAHGGQVKLPPLPGKKSFQNAGLSLVGQHKEAVQKRTASYDGSRVTGGGGNYGASGVHAIRGGGLNDLGTVLSRHNSH